MEPFELEIVQDHPFKKKKPDPETGKKRIGCEVCGHGKLHHDHLGAPPSMNDGGSGMDRMAFQALKQAWQSKIVVALLACGLPKNLESLSVEGQIGFPDYRERDQGNHRWMIEKALGDALVKGEWLPSDSFFPQMRYEFGGLQGTHTPGESWTRLMIFPSMTEPEAAPRAERGQGQQVLSLPI